jgi:RNA polymerase sigma-70 factor (ECF subfamily)
VCSVVEAVEVDLAGWVPVDVDELSGGFEAVYQGEYRRLVCLAFALTGSWAAAEDLTQETFLRLHQRWNRVSRYDRPDAWLRRVLVNLATSRARRLATEAKLLTRLGRERPGPILSAEGADFWAAVRSLPRRQAQAIALVYLEDRTTADVAGILGCADATVRAHLHQARRTLRHRLAPDDNGEEL